MASRGPVLDRNAHRGQGEHQVGGNRAGNASDNLGGQVGRRVTPGHAAEGCIDERHDWVEMTARDGAEHQDDREQPGCGGGGVLQQLEAGIAGRQALGGDARADHQRGQESAAQELGS